MSSLAALLAGDVAPRTYRLSAGVGVGDVRRTVEDAGWRFAYVDGASAATKPDLLIALGAALDFPDHYGHNFDALADCLHGVDAGDRHGTVMLWDGTDTLARADPHAFGVALTVLGVRVDAKRGGPFAVLLRGEEPEPVGVPVLD